MRLSTYNFLTSKAIKGVKVGFPLKLTVSKTGMCSYSTAPPFIYILERSSQQFESILPLLM